MDLEKMGRFSPLPDEIKRIREEAIEAGLDPEQAEANFRQKIDLANERLKEERRNFPR